MKYLFYYDYKICNLFKYRFGIAEEDGAVCRIIFSWKTMKKPDNFREVETPLLKKAASQLGEYFNGRRKVFNLPITLKGTDFQVKIWTALQNIPYGETLSYSELAAIAENPKACRAVGMANNRNPLPVLIPCHRIIGKDGSLTGYAGGLELKQKLLEMESKNT